MPVWEVDRHILVKFSIACFVKVAENHLYYNPQIHSIFFYFSILSVGAIAVFLLINGLCAYSSVEICNSSLFFLFLMSLNTAACSESVRSILEAFHP